LAFGSCRYFPVPQFIRHIIENSVFDVEAQGLDLTGKVTNLVVIGLRVGNDVGSTEIRLTGQLSLEKDA